MVARFASDPFYDAHCLPWSSIEVEDVVTDLRKIWDSKPNRLGGANKWRWDVALVRKKITRTFADDLGTDMQRVRKWVLFETKQAVKNFHSNTQKTWKPNFLVAFRLLGARLPEPLPAQAAIWLAFGADRLRKAFTRQRDGPDGEEASDSNPDVTSTPSSKGSTRQRDSEAGSAAKAHMPKAHRTSSTAGSDDASSPPGSNAAGPQPGANLPEQSAAEVDRGHCGNAVLRRQPSDTANCKCVVALILQANSPWAILGVEASADDKQIRAAYRRLAKAVHPDKCDHPMATRAFQMLRQAFESCLD